MYLDLRSFRPRASGMAGSRYSPVGLLTSLNDGLRPGFGSASGKPPGCCSRLNLLSRCSRRPRSRPRALGPFRAASWEPGRVHLCWPGRAGTLVRRLGPEMPVQGLQGGDLRNRRFPRGPGRGIGTPRVGGSVRRVRSSPGDAVRGARLGGSASRRWFHSRLASQPGAGSPERRPASAPRPWERRGCGAADHWRRSAAAAAAVGAGDRGSAPQPARAPVRPPAGAVPRPPSPVPRLPPLPPQNRRRRRSPSR